MKDYTKIMFLRTAEEEKLFKSQLQCGYCGIKFSGKIVKVFDHSHTTGTLCKIYLQFLMIILNKGCFRTAACQGSVQLLCYPSPL